MRREGGRKGEERNNGKLWRQEGEVRGKEIRIVIRKSRNSVEDMKERRQRSEGKVTERNQARKKLRTVKKGRKAKSECTKGRKERDAERQRGDDEMLEGGKEELHKRETFRTVRKEKEN